METVSLIVSCVGTRCVSELKASLFPCGSESARRERLRANSPCTYEHRGRARRGSEGSKSWENAI